MSIHPSLKVDLAGAQQRTVLSRIERIKDLMKKELWTEGHAVTSLPKTKIIKIKSKKAKKEDVAADGTAAPVADAKAPAAGAKAPAAGAKAAPAAGAKAAAPAAGAKAAPAAKK